MAPKLHAGRDAPTREKFGRVRKRGPHGPSVRRSGVLAQLFRRRRRLSHVVVWDDYRVVYVRVPKSANSSLRSAIPGGVPQRLDLRSVEPRYPEHLTFSFVRNPWARLVSIWSQKIRSEPVTDAKFYLGVHRCFVQHGLPMRYGMPFEEFAELACELPETETEKHLKSQASFLVREGRVLPRFVGRIETMQEDWARLAALAGFDFELPHRNRSEHAPYPSYYGSRLAERVGERYRADVEAFGYSFEPR